jgi:hypothetical protein
MTRPEIAKRAIEELIKQGANIVADDLDLADYYVDRGYEYLEDLVDGLNPHEHATERAKAAVLEYTKGSLLGLSNDQNESFAIATARWRRKAAAIVNSAFEWGRDAKNEDWEF